MVKKILLNLVIVLMLFVTTSYAYEMKVGGGVFDKNPDTTSGTNMNYEEDMQEFMFIFQTDKLPYDLNPMIGALIANSSHMIYLGLQRRFEIGRFSIIPSFAPGYYNDGKGKPMGSEYQFKSQLELAYKFSDGYEIGFARSHISNGDLGNTNPGADIEMIYINKKY